MIDTLLQNTPYLAAGFATNLLISVLSMTFGTLLGGGLGAIRWARFLGAGGTAGFATNICRNVPSFVLLFYMSFMIPSEITWGETIIAVPLWIKATLALTFPVIGFVSDQSFGYFETRNNDRPAARETFVVAWVQYLLIIIMASATASVIGTDEIVGRANILISQHDSAQFLLVTYLYVSIWFLVTGLIFSSVIKGVLAYANKTA